MDKRVSLNRKLGLNKNTSRHDVESCPTKEYEASILELDSLIEAETNKSEPKHSKESKVTSKRSNSSFGLERTNNVNNECEKDSTNG